MRNRSKARWPIVGVQIAHFIVWPRAGRNSDGARRKPAQCGGPSNADPVPSGTVAVAIKWRHSSAAIRIFTARIRVYLVARSVGRTYKSIAFRVGKIYAHFIPGHDAAVRRDAAHRIATRRCETSRIGMHLIAATATSAWPTGGRRNQ